MDGARTAGKLEAIFRTDCARNFRNIPDYDLHDRVILRAASGGELDGIQQEDLSPHVNSANGDDASVPFADAFAADQDFAAVNFPREVCVGDALVQRLVVWHLLILHSALSGFEIEEAVGG